MKQRPHRRSSSQGSGIKETTVESAVPTNPPTIRRRNKTPKQKESESKRQSSSHNSSFFTPSRDYVACKQQNLEGADLSGSNSPTIRELKVGAVRVIQPRDGEMVPSNIYGDPVQQAKVSTQNKQRYMAVWSMDSELRRSVLLSCAT